MDKSHHLFPAAASIKFRFRGKLPDMLKMLQYFLKDATVFFKKVTIFF